MRRWTFDLLVLILVSGLFEESGGRYFSGFQNVGSVGSTKIKHIRLSLQTFTMVPKPIWVELKYPLLVSFIF